MSCDNSTALSTLPWLDRRTVLKTGLLTMATGLISSLATPAIAASKMQSTSATYKIAFRNAHTGESFNGVYRIGNKYLPHAFTQINHVLRDFRTGNEHPIDPHTIDIIYNVRNKMKTSQPLEILSGYRSPQTNAMLREAGPHTGVALNSLHMVGQALDIRMDNYSTKHIRDLAMNLRAGGVGYYPASDFVHVDSGKIRHW